MKKFSELDDQGIATSTEELVRAGAVRLEAIREIDGELFINALQSSALLCLAGIRAESPYHNFSKIVSAKQIAAYNKLLAPVGIALFSEDILPFTKVTDTVTWFSFINIKQLAHLSDRYAFLTGTSVPPVAHPADTLLTYAIFSAQQYELCTLMDAEKLPKAWSRSWVSGLVLRFGMQLGYPGSAISAYLWAESVDGPDYDSLHEIMVDDTMAFFGTQISFGCSPSKTRAKDVQQFIQAASDVIHHFREKFPENSVQADVTTALAYKKLKAADQRFSVGVK